MRAGSRVAVPFVSHRDDQMSRIFSCLDVGTASSFAARLTRHPLHVDGTSWDDVPSRGEGKMRNNITIKSRIKTSQFQGQAMEFDVPFHILPSLILFFYIPLCIVQQKGIRLVSNFISLDREWKNKHGSYLTAVCICSDAHRR